MMRCPIRPQAPLTPMVIFMGGFSRLGVYLNRLDDLVQVVGHLNGAVGESGSANAALAQDFVEGLLVGAVIGDSGGRVFELMAGQDADDALARLDHAFLAQF